ncbi:MAG: hypothetical protein AAGE18_05975 [Pseudomonadota bacterium]
MRFGLMVMAGLLAMSGGAWAQAIVLSPAQPQPNEASLSPGLAVSYAYPGDVRSLADAERNRSRAVPGPALVGLDYVDTARGVNALTSDRSEKVVAFIRGYMRFDSAGEYRLEFHSNDGLRVEIGGAEVYRSDYRHPCETEGWETVSIPEPGWYPLEATFFQRLQTSCLMLRWEDPDGNRAWTSNTVFAH